MIWPYISFLIDFGYKILITIVDRREDLYKVQTVRDAYATGKWAAIKIKKKRLNVNSVVVIKEFND